MSKVIKLTETQIKNIIKDTIKEQHGSGPWFNDGPGPGKLKTRTVSKPVVIPGSLFPTGSDRVDINGDAYRKAVAAIMDALNKTSDLSVKVVGGASAAGATLSYNTKLAKNRSQNFVNMLSKQFPTIKFTVGEPVVGNATKVGSTEALAQQNVTLYFTTTEQQQYVTQAIDNTANRINFSAQKLKELPRDEKIKVKKIRVCYEIPEFLYNIMGIAYKQYEVK
jgi:hypothetical protein